MAAQYRRGGCPAPSAVPECSDSHELETLMPPGSQEPSEPLAEAPEEQGLMASVNSGEGEDIAAAEPKVKPARSHSFFELFTSGPLIFSYF